jgi:hypothetical protein
MNKNLFIILVFFSGCFFSCEDPGGSVEIPPPEKEQVVFSLPQVLWETDIKTLGTIGMYSGGPLYTNGYMYFIEQYTAAECRIVTLRLSDGQIMWGSPPASYNYWGVSSLFKNFLKYEEHIIFPQNSSMMVYSDLDGHLETTDQRNEDDNLTYTIRAISTD